MTTNAGLRAFTDTYPGTITDQQETEQRWDAALRAGFCPDDIITAAQVHGRLARSQGFTPWPAELFLGEVADFIDDDDDPPAVASAIRAMRHGWDWTQAELACRAGCSVGTIQKIEDGSDARLSTLTGIARAFGMSLSDLLDLGDRFLR